MIGLLGLVIASLVACSSPTITQVIVVRHAEKADASKDPELSELGQARARALAQVVGKAKLGAVYATQFKRTQATVTPAATAQGVPVTPLDAGDAAGLAARITKDHAGQVVLVAAHSNTVPKVIASLGGPTIPDLADDAFGDLFIVTLIAGEPARLLHLQYAAPAP